MLGRRGVADVLQQTNDCLHLFGLTLAYNERCIVVIDNDQVLDADSGDRAPAGVDENVRGIDKDAVAVLGHGGFAFAYKCRQTVPAPDVAPASGKGQEGILSSRSITA